MSVLPKTMQGKSTDKLTWHSEIAEAFRFRLQLSRDAERQHFGHRLSPFPTEYGAKLHEYFAGMVQAVRYCRVKVRNPQLEKATRGLEDAI